LPGKAHFQAQRILFLALVPTLTVLAFNLCCFVSDPESDASIRVGLVVVASIAEVGVFTVP